MKQIIFFLLFATTLLFSCKSDFLESEKLIISPQENQKELKSGIVINLTPSDDIVNCIREAGDNTRIHLGPGDYVIENAAIYLENKSNFTIEGDGNETRVIFVRNDLSSTSPGFRLLYNLSNITIQNFSIVGVPRYKNKDYYIRGIGNEQGAQNINGITVRSMDINSVAVGISFGGGGSDVRNVTICNNRISDIYGVFTDTGAGIKTSFVHGVKIEGNFIENATRHSIYQANEPLPEGSDPMIEIKNNFVLNHGMNNIYSEFSSAICIARTRGVVVSNNIVMNSKSVSISVEFDERDSAIPTPVQNIHLINNQIVGGHTHGIWMNTGTEEIPNYELGNRIILYPGVNKEKILLENHEYNGSPTILTPPNGNDNWSRDNWTYTTYYNNNTYLINNNSNILYKIESLSWNYSTSHSNWFDTEGLTSIEDMLYIVQNGVLHEVNPTDWSYRYSTTNWGGTQYMSSANGYIHIVQNNILHRVNPSDLSYFHTAENWSGIQWMCSWKDNLYIMKNGEYFEVDPFTLQSTQILTY
jgi:hypothetical protein